MIDAPSNPRRSRNNALIAIATWIALLVALMPGAAYAYLDPGIASFVVQGIIGAVAAVGVAATGYWRKLVAMLRRKQAANGSSDSKHPSA